MLLVSTKTAYLNSRLCLKALKINQSFSITATFHSKGPKILDIINSNKVKRLNKKSDRDSTSTPSSSSESSSSSLTWYSCGPTVYDQAHIGHARTYVCSDIIRRILEDYFNISVNYAMGITDIDDKIIQKCKELGLYEWQDIESFTRDLEIQFFRDMDILNVKRPNAVLRVTEHIDDILKYIDQIYKLGYAYIIPDDGIYFDVAKLGSRYGTLCPIPPSNITTATTATDNSNNSNNSNDDGVNNDVSSSPSSKRHWRDFALWKFTPTTIQPSPPSSLLSVSPSIPLSPQSDDNDVCNSNSNGSNSSNSKSNSNSNSNSSSTSTASLVSTRNSNDSDSIVSASSSTATNVTGPGWTSQWGRGRPGWHIECSAMTHAYFGPSIDIHSGGVDLKFPHHTNEIAQSETHNGCCDSDGSQNEWVNAWLHTGHLYIQGRKMSKSLKNFISIQQYLASQLPQLTSAGSEWDSSGGNNNNNSSSSSSDSGSSSSNNNSSSGNSISTDSNSTTSSSGNSSDGGRNNSVSSNNNSNSIMAAIDFRLFCLQHKYHASVHFSSDRITDASQFRIKIQHLVNLYQSVIEQQQLQQQQLQQQQQKQQNVLMSNDCDNFGSNSHNNNSSHHHHHYHHHSPSKRTTTRSCHLQATLQSTQFTVHDALCDDFDTPVVMRALSTLSVVATQYASDLMMYNATISSSSTIQDRDDDDSSSTMSNITAADSQSLSSSLTSLPPVGPLEPLIAVMEYIRKVLTVVGLEAMIPATAVAVAVRVLQNNDINNYGSSSSSSSNSSNNTSFHQPDPVERINSSNSSSIMTTSNMRLIDILVKFRATVRTKCLKANKSSKIKKKMKKDTIITNNDNLSTIIINNDDCDTSNKKIFESQQQQQQQRQKEQEESNTAAAAAPGEALQELLQLCDTLRDKELLTLGIQIIEDSSSMKSSTSNSSSASSVSSVSSSSNMNSNVSDGSTSRLWKPVLPK